MNSFALCIKISNQTKTFIYCKERYHKNTFQTNHYKKYLFQTLDILYKMFNHLSDLRVQKLLITFLCDF